jgi:hypothetical protein
MIGSEKLNGGGQHSIFNWLHNLDSEKIKQESFQSLNHCWALSISEINKSWSSMDQ